ncbi:MAG TPA: sulfatase-like hydrolase/transferase [Vicinamibacterales bacterium]|nr:sulfatase-like hydrolase/transferase [Vicinamibacterales bacterium]
MNIRRLLRAVVCAVVVASGALWQARPGHSQTRPNIVVILLDDFDAETLEVAVAKGLAPNIAQYLAGQGYTFTNAFTTTTFGSPARATYLTGQYAHNHGEFGTDPILGGAPRLNESATVATWLKTAGYRTGLVGRHLTGYGLFTPATRIPPGWDSWSALIDPTTWSMDKYVLNVNGTLVDVGAAAAASGVELHQTDILAYLAGTFIRSAPLYLRPFFLTVTPVVFNRERWPGPTIHNVCPNPADTVFGGNYWGVAQKPAARHIDTVTGDVTAFPLPKPPSFNEEDMSDKPLWAQQNPQLTETDIDCLQKRYWRKLEALRGVDDLVGHVIGSLQAAGTLNNTMVILTSDAGDNDGRHRFPEKMLASEQALRVPLYVRMAGGSQPVTIPRLVLATDLAPTIVHAASALPTITMDGRSLLPLIQNPALATWRRIGLIEHALVPPLDTPFASPPTYLAARTDAAAPRMFVRYPTVTAGVNGELYDLSLDPHQIDNVFTAPARQTEVARLNAWLNALRTCKGLVCTLVENTY